jgi:hypothetical protein
VIADIGGGGKATVLTAILARHPEGRGILFDQAHVVAQAPDDERIEVIAGSFFDAVPPSADAYVMKNILHDWEVVDCLRILKTIRRDMPDRARLVLLERMLDADEYAIDVAFSDLNMLIGPGGAERTAAGYTEILAEAGFAVTAVVRTASEYSVIEASPV